MSIGWSGSSPMTDSFEPEVRALEFLDRTCSFPPNPVLFVGSSSIRLWPNLPAAFPGWNVLNRGFGGSKMGDLLHFFPRLVTAYRPSLIFVYEGDNDLAIGLPPDRVVQQFEEFLVKCRVQLPGIPIVLLAVKPSPLRVSLLAAQQDLNRRLQQFSNTHPGVFFLDTAAPLLDAAGLPRPEFFQTDRLHLNPQAYAVWQTVVAGFLEQHRHVGKSPTVP